MTYKTLKKLRISAFAGVDTPAQEPAVVKLLKRDSNTGLNLKKGAVLTTSVAGHAHLISTADGQGELSSGFTTWDDSGHQHPWTRLTSGTIQIGDSVGHTHAVAQFEENEMNQDGTQDQPTTTAQTQPEVPGSGPGQGAGMGQGVPGGGQGHGQGQGLNLRAPVQEDEVVDVGGGVTVSKSVDPVAYKLALEVQDLKKRAADEMLEKRALVELAHLPGSAADRALLLKAADSSPGTLEVLRAADALFAKSFAPVGTAETPTTDSPAEALQKMVSDHAKAASLSMAAAYSAVLATPEGRALYDKAQN